MEEKETVTCADFKLVESETPGFQSPKEFVGSISAEPSDYYTAVESVSSDKKVAISHWDYYVERFARFIKDLSLACFVGVLLSPFLWGLGERQELVSTLGFFLLLVIIKTVRSLNICDKRTNGFYVLKRDGKSLSALAAIWRALILVLTLPIFPIHLITVAAGSRRFLHDVSSGTYVRSPGENPEITFYPPPPVWWMPLFLSISLVAVSISFSSVRILEQIEIDHVPKILGQNSNIFYQYLLIREAFRVIPVSPEDAKLRLTFAEDFCRLQSRIKSIKDTESMIYAAHIAARAGNVERCKYWLIALRGLPQMQVEVAIYESPFLTVKSGPEDDYISLIDEVCGLKPGDLVLWRHGTPQLLNKAERVAALRREIFGLNSTVTAVGYLNAAVVASGVGNKAAAQLWIDKLEALDQDILGKAAKDTMYNDIDYDMPGTAVLCQVLSIAGATEMSVEIADAEMRKALRERSTDGYWIFCRTLSLVLRECGDEVKANLVLREGSEVLQKEAKEALKARQAQKAKDLQWKANYLKAVIDSNGQFRW